MFAENRLAPFMGSTVCEEYSGDDSADAAATWIVLKACVAEWELRLRSVCLSFYVSVCLSVSPCVFLSSMDNDHSSGIWLGLKFFALSKISVCRL